MRATSVLGIRGTRRRARECDQIDRSNFLIDERALDLEHCFPGELAR